MSKIVIADFSRNSIQNTEATSFIDEVTPQDGDRVIGGLKPPTVDDPASWWFRAGRVTALRATGLVGGAFLAGWEAGEWLNENTPIQEWISDAIL
jgi:hypothetical protein